MQENLWRLFPFFFSFITLLCVKIAHKAFCEGNCDYSPIIHACILSVSVSTQLFPYFYSSFVKTYYFILLFSIFRFCFFLFVVLLYLYLYFAMQITEQTAQQHLEFSFLQFPLDFTARIFRPRGVVIVGVRDDV